MLRTRTTSARSVILGSLAVASSIVGCTMDFGTFQPVPGAADAAGQSDVTKGADGSTATPLPNGGAASGDGAPGSTDACAAAAACASTATSCAGSCDQTHATCVAPCNNNACKAACNNTRDTCRATCTSQCQACAGAACISDCP